MKRSLRYSAVAFVMAIGVVGSPMGVAYAEPSEPMTTEPAPPPQVVYDEQPAVVDAAPVPAAPAPAVAPPVHVQLPPAVPAQPEPAPAPPVEAVVPAPQVAVPMPAPAAPAPAPAPVQQAPDQVEAVVPAPQAPVQPQAPKPVPAPAPQVQLPKPETPAADDTVEEAPEEEAAEPQERAETPGDTPAVPPATEGTPAVTEGGAPAEGTTPASESDESSTTEDGQDSTQQQPEGSTPEAPAPAGQESAPAEVVVEEAPKPAEALPVPEEVLAMTPEVVTVAAIDDVDDKRSGPPLPIPGRDQVVHHDDDDDETPPANPNIVINGDGNTINIINVGGDVNGDINQDISDDDRFIVLRPIGRPGHEIRFPIRPNHPIQLPPNWCGGRSEAWAFAGVGFGPGGVYANFGAGVFHSNGNCGFNPRPPRPQHWPAQLVICPPHGYYGPARRFDHYTFVDARTIFVNNTFVQGNFVNQVIDNVPQQVFVPDGFSRDIVYQAPTQAPPRWMGFQGYGPLGENPNGSEDTVLVATDNRMRNAGLTGLTVLVLAIIGGGIYLSKRAKS